MTFLKTYSGEKITVHDWYEPVQAMDIGEEIARYLGREFNPD